MSRTAVKLKRPSENDVAEAPPLTSPVALRITRVRGFISVRVRLARASMRAGRAGHQILYARAAPDETVQRAPSKARVAWRPYPDNGHRLARGRAVPRLRLEQRALREHPRLPIPP